MSESDSVHTEAIIHQSPASSYKTRVLVVDDDNWVRELLVTVLSEAGYEVESASNAQDAIAKLRVSFFDLVLSDIRMPGMDGISLSSYLSKIHMDTPVVLITGYGQASMARNAIREGASDYITKPFQVETIPIVVERNLERHRLERLRVVEQNSRVMYRAVQALAAAIDAKESNTAEHSRRVANLSRIISEGLHLPASERNILDLAAYVHDVGKIGTPDSVLNKAGKLNEEEWEMMRQHAIQGAEIVGQVRELAYVADVVRHHHEWMDGSGYPDGLRGESIPLLSRIIAVADAYDTMTTDRIYRPRRSPAEALKELQNNVGNQFDHAVVTAFTEQHTRRIAR
ncbi:MAG: response regulator [Armatimonadetes bacterium]|nr:response regulator [Armatimonadota bacterium]